MYKFFQNLAKIYLLCFGFELMSKSYTYADTDADAKAIVDSKFDSKTIDNILLYRTQDECIAINDAVAKLNGGKPLVDRNYLPIQNMKPYDDLRFALVSDPMTVFCKYLEVYFANRDETFIIMIFIQVDDREELKQIYGVERPNWNGKCRDQLEYVLMKESFDDSKNSIHCYGTKHSDQPKKDLIDDITRSIDNHDLVDIYTSLVRYVQNREAYLAQVLHDHCDDKNNWSMWIIIVTLRRGEGVTAIDKEFQSQYKVTLKNYIKTCTVQDPKLKEMLTILVDPASVSKRQPCPPPSSE